MERRTQGVFAISGAGNGSSGFSKDGVVEGDNQWLGRIAEGFDFCLNLPKDDLGVNPLLGVELVVRAPIFELAPGGG
jgi:hypothetical protein